MPTHRGFTAWITCQGRTLPEFRLEVDEVQHVVSCWVPCYEDQAFIVHWRDLGGYVDTSAYIFLDGHVVPGRFLFGFGEAERGAMRVGPETERPFMFTKVEEGRTNETDEGSGVIKLKIKRIKRVASRLPNTYSPPPPSKGVSGGRCIGYGGERPAPKQLGQTWSSEPFDPNDLDVYVTFVFYYRPIDALLAQATPTSGEMQANAAGPEGEEDLEDERFEEGKDEEGHQDFFYLTQL